MSGLVQLRRLPDELLADTEVVALVDGASADLDWWPVTVEVGHSTGDSDGEPTRLTWFRSGEPTHPRSLLEAASRRGDRIPEREPAPELVLGRVRHLDGTETWMADAPTFVRPLRRVTVWRHRSVEALRRELPPTARERAARAYRRLRRDGARALSAWCSTVARRLARAARWLDVVAERTGPGR